MHLDDRAVERHCVASLLRAAGAVNDGLGPIRGTQPAAAVVDGVAGGGWTRLLGAVAVGADQLVERSERRSAPPAACRRTSAG